MQEFLNIALSFPTVVWSALMIVALGYWMFVILGALDLELLDVDVDVDLDADFDIDLDVDSAEANIEADADADVSKWAPLAKMAMTLGIGKVPMTILLTLLIVSGWGLSYFSVLYLGSMVRWGALFGAVVLVGSFVAALPIMGALAHPLKGIFETTTKRAGVRLIGQVCDVTTGKVTADFGQASLEDGGAGLLLSIRCDEPNDLKRKSTALIIGYEKEKNVYFVEPYEQMLVDGDDDAHFEAAMQPATEEAHEEVAG